MYTYVNHTTNLLVNGIGYIAGFLLMEQPYEITSNGFAETRINNNDTLRVYFCVFLFIVDGSDIRTGHDLIRG